MNGGKSLNSLSLVFRLGVNFVLPLSQEEEQQEKQEESVSQTQNLALNS